jgi:hypothetical protein
MVTFYLFYCLDRNRQDNTLPEIIDQTGFLASEIHRVYTINIACCYECYTILNMQSIRLRQLALLYT